MSLTILQAVLYHPIAMPCANQQYLQMHMTCIAVAEQLARAAAQPRENGRASLANGQAAEQPIANGRAESASSGVLQSIVCVHACVGSYSACFITCAIPAHVLYYTLLAASREPDSTIPQNAFCGQLCSCCCCEACAVDCKPSSCDCAAEEADTLQEGEADGDVSQPDYRPSPGAPLGEAGRSHGRELIAAMRHARHVLQASLQNLAGARDEAVYAQRAFYPLMRLLEDADSLMRTCSKAWGAGCCC